MREILGSHGRGLLDRGQISESPQEKVEFARLQIELKNHSDHLASAVDLLPYLLALRFRQVGRSQHTFVEIPQSSIILLLVNLLKFRLEGR